MPKVSVIIPCYNQWKFIREAVDSVLAQTYNDYEIIIVNDGSDDGSSAGSIDKLKNEKISIHHIANVGVSAARNYGVSVSSGEYILPLDADDIIRKDFLELTVPLLEEENGFRLVATGATYFGDENANAKLPPYSRTAFLTQNLFFNTSLFRRSDFKALGGYDENFKDGWEDWDFYLRLVTKPEHVHVVMDHLLRYRIKKISRNASIILDRKKRAEQQLFKKHITQYLEVFPEPIQLLRDNEWLWKQHKEMHEVRSQLQKSYSYRLGHFLLKPLKLITGKTVND